MLLSAATSGSLAGAQKAASAAAACRECTVSTDGLRVQLLQVDHGHPWGWVMAALHCGLAVLPSQ
jgi:hypothetical protein